MLGARAEQYISKVFTWKFPVRIELFELVDNGLQLFRITAGDGPFEVGRQMGGNMLGGEVSRVACCSKQNNLIVSV